MRDGRDDQLMVDHYGAQHGRKKAPPIQLDDAVASRLAPGLAASTSWSTMNGTPPSN